MKTALLISLFVLSTSALAQVNEASLTAAVKPTCRVVATGLMGNKQFSEVTLLDQSSGKTLGLSGVVKKDNEGDYYIVAINGSTDLTHINLQVLKNSIDQNNLVGSAIGGKNKSGKFIATFTVPRHTIHVSCQ